MTGGETIREAATTTRTFGSTEKYLTDMADDKRAATRCLFAYSVETEARLTLLDL
jgi:hypothetical protein